MINTKTDVSEYLDSKKGKSTSESFVASIPNEEIICGCNGVTKGAIVKAIETQGLNSVEQIKGCTNASRSCGGCKPLVAELLELTTGSSISNEKEPICGCTTLSIDEVEKEIREKHLTSTREVMNVLDWNTVADVRNASLH